MQTKHTPGRWFCEGDGSTLTLMVYAVPEDDHGAAIPIADCAFSDAPESIGDEAEANARLIAAAPDLLAALDYIANKMGAPISEPEMDENGDDYMLGLWHCAEVARAAIAAAQGEVAP